MVESPPRCPANVLGDGTNSETQMRPQHFPLLIAGQSRTSGHGAPAPVPNPAHAPILRARSGSTSGSAALCFLAGSACTSGPFRLPRPLRVPSPPAPVSHPTTAHSAHTARRTETALSHWTHPLPYLPRICPLQEGPHVPSENRSLAGFPLRVHIVGRS